MDNCSPSNPLDRYLVQAGLLTQTQVAMALADQEATGMCLSEILAAQGWIDEKTLEYLLQKLVPPKLKISNVIAKSVELRKQSAQLINHAKNIRAVTAEFVISPKMGISELLSYYEAGERNFDKVDLQGINLSGLNLTGINFAQANLSRTDLSGATLHRANLTRANLTKATLQNTDLSQANLTRANLDGAVIDWVVLTDALIPDGLIQPW
jgi:hypothetical protein